jgi:hypothetical protein
MPVRCSAVFIVVMRHGLKGIGAVADWAGPILFCIYMASPLFVDEGRVFAKSEISKERGTLAQFWIYLAVRPIGGDIVQTFPISRRYKIGSAACH